jgi:uncharacterized membrane protein YkoI
MSFRTLAIAAFLVALSSPAPADEKPPLACLSKSEQQAAIASGQAVKLAPVIRAVAGRRARDVVKADLCRSPKGLVYLLTVLARDGKVTRVMIDAVTGQAITSL